jgi:116 kDa U5 small nuclear ribonucleoprotein component
MASLDDYDEFGNYIGADLDSEDEDVGMGGQDFVPVAEDDAAEPLEGYNDRPANEPQLSVMEVDGSRHFYVEITLSLLTWHLRAIQDRCDFTRR